MSQAKVQSGLEPTSEHSARPASGGIGFVVVAFDAWSDLRFARHQLVARFARTHPVVWLNPGHLWRNTPTVVRRYLGGGSVHGAAPIVHESLPWTPVLPGRPGNWTFRRRLRRAVRELDRLGCTKRVLYTFRPLPGVLASGSRFDLTCYHVSDEYYSRPDSTPDPGEEAFAREVDQMFVHSEASMNKKAGMNPNMLWVPNGVDFPAYSTTVDEPEDLRKIPHPRIGYSGHVKVNLDWELIETLVPRHPDWSFVFVGKIKNEQQIGDTVRRLQAFPNVHFLGAKSFDELAGYPQHFDVCVMPYRLDDYTRFIYPLKLHEYLASGRPVVSAAVPAIAPFENEVAIATGVDAWTAAVREMLSPSRNTPERQAARQEIAREFDWERLTQRVLDVVLERLDGT